jgi:hypothetical protein
LDFNDFIGPVRHSAPFQMGPRKVCSIFTPASLSDFHAVARSTLGVSHFQRLAKRFQQFLRLLNFLEDTGIAFHFLKDCPGQVFHYLDGGVQFGEEAAVGFLLNGMQTEPGGLQIAFLTKKVRARYIGSGRMVRSFRRSFEFVMRF